MNSSFNNNFFVYFLMVLFANTLSVVRVGRACL